MATAFSAQERERIRDSLLDAALKSAASQGMRHATVDELAREAGISKGAFYRFYPSKEHLFLSMLERTHEEMYGSAERVLAERTDLPLRERTMRAILEVFRVAETYNLIPFIREEVPLLLRRLPDEVVNAHYVTDDERIKRLILKAGARLTTSMETACITVRMLMMSISFRQDVGAGFEEALRLMVEGACDRVLA